MFISERILLNLINTYRLIANIIWLIFYYNSTNFDIKYIRKAKPSLKQGEYND